MPASLSTPSTFYHHTFDQGTFNRIKNLGAPFFEGLRDITENDVNQFLLKIRRLAGRPLPDCLRMSPRDGTIALSHRKTESVNGVIHTRIFNVFTIVQDYTHRCSFNFDQGWGAPRTEESVVQPEHIPTVMQNFGEAQRYLLKQGHFLPDRFPHSSAYLHIVREDLLQSVPNTVVYTVETAYRHVPSRDNKIVRFRRFENKYAYFPYDADFTRRACSNSEITMWAMCHLVLPRENFDRQRLEIIKKCSIAATMVPPRNTLNPIDPLNTYELLKCRASGHQDGRARYPVLRGVLKSKAIINTLHPFDPMPAKMMRENPVMIQRNCGNIGNVLASFTLALLSAVVVHKLVFSMFDDDQDVLSFLVILCLSYLLWGRTITGSAELNSLFQLERQMNAVELVENSKSKSHRYQTETLTTNECLRYYDGFGLSWTGREYTGFIPYKERVWKASELYQAGYDMTYCRDGREGLLLPVENGSVGSRRVLRLVDVDAESKASFKEVSKDSPAPFVRGNEPGDERNMLLGVWKDTGSLWSNDIKCV